MAATSELPRSWPAVPNSGFVSRAPYSVIRTDAAANRGQLASHLTRCDRGFGPSSRSRFEFCRFLRRQYRLFLIFWPLQRR